VIQRFLILAFLLPALSAAQEAHDHPAPEKLGTASFPISCQPGVQQEFNRAVALLHSFAYRPLRRPSAAWPLKILTVQLPIGVSR
jgi:hypothetical protein